MHVDGDPACNQDRADERGTISPAALVWRHELGDERGIPSAAASPFGDWGGAGAEAMAERLSDLIKRRMRSKVTSLVHDTWPNPLVQREFLRSGSLSDPFERELYSILERGGCDLVRCEVELAAQQSGGHLPYHQMFAIIERTFCSSRSYGIALVALMITCSRLNRVMKQLKRPVCENWKT